MMENLFKHCVIPLVLAAAAAPALADNYEQNSVLQDAWLDGNLGAIVVLNKHLNPFKIETDVVNGKAFVTGQVDSSAQKNLMTELAMGVEGIERVDNQLQVAGEHDVTYPSESVFSSSLDDSITTAISTRLLLNSNIDSSGINASTESQKVILLGKAGSEIERDLSEQIAQNTFEVDAVLNRLEIADLSSISR